MYIYIIIGVIILILIYILIAYNSFIHSKNLVNEAFSTMNIYLKKRWDIIPNLVEAVKGYSIYEKETLTKIIPNLVEAVKGYSIYEKETLTKITSLRNSNYDSLSMNNKINLNEEISKYLSTIIAVSENYPDLKANDLFSKLSTSLIEIEDEIANSRKYYNGTVRIFNNKIQMFPNNLVAKIFKFKEFKMFEADTNEKNNIEVNLNE